MKIMTVALAVIFTCITSGCGLIDSRKLAGYYDPKLVVKKTIWGFEAEVSTDFSGTIDATYNPETHEFILKGQVNSNSASVLAAQGERADHLVQMRLEEMKMVVERDRLVGENFKAFGQMIAIAAMGGGDAVAKVVDAAAPILKGSGGSFNSSLLGAGKINLGESTPPPIVGPVP